MLLSYLARGLTGGTPGPGRFALTPPDDDSRWKNLGITPIHYPLSAPPESRHAQLPIALSAWAEQSQAGALAVEERIRGIVSGGTPLPPEEDDYLKESLADVSTTRFFTRHARGVQWLQWIETQPCFVRIFDIHSHSSECENELTSWFASAFAVQHSDEALEVVRRKGGGMSLRLWQEVSHVLFRERVHGLILSKWVCLLLATALPNLRRDVLEYILSHCSYPDDEVSALLLFDHLTRPVIQLEESLKWSDGGDPGTTVGVELDCAGSDYWLQQSWNTLFLPNLDALAKRLCPTVTSHLNNARRLLMSFGKASANWDPLSHSRGMIESRSQDHLHNGLSSLIDAGAAIITWASEHDSDWANALITDWLASESPLLRRLAVFGMAASVATSADDKLRWVVRNELLYRFGFKHEVFLLLRGAYPQASGDARESFLKEVVNQYEPHDRDTETADYELYNLIVWLTNSDPSCKLAAKLLLEPKTKHPIYGERAHPDMDSWIGPASYVQERETGRSADLASYNVQQVMEALAAAPDTNYPGGPSKEALRYDIGQEARRSHEWGVNLARQAQGASMWSQDIWEPLIGAWAATDLTSDQWATVLDVLHTSPAVYETAVQSLTSLLERGVDSATGPIPTTLLERAKIIADAIWVQCENTAPEASSQDTDWLGRAINRPAGRLFEFYLHSMARLQRESVLTPARLREYERVLATAVHGASFAAQLARVLLASQLHFLFSLDPSWTTEHLFPLLDVQEDQQRAKQCWHGYLYWGRWSDVMLEKLLPAYEGMFSLIEVEKDEFRRIFCGHLASIAVYSSVNPLEHGWLFRFLAIVRPTTRALWAGALHEVIQGLDDNAKLHLWQRWLNTYWQQRLQGRPVPLDAKETDQMLEWVLDLQPVLPEVVGLFCQGPYPDLGHEMPYYRLSKSELLVRYPESFAQLLAFMTQGERNRAIYDLSELHIAVERLVSLIPRDPQLRVLCDDLARLGVPGVETLAKRLANQEDASLQGEAGDPVEN